MEIKIKDTRFLLSDFLEQQASQKYNGIQREIDIKGYINLNTDIGSVKVYRRELAEILISNSLPALNIETQIETTINGLEYLNSFVEGYKEGEQYFEAEWKVSSNTLYGGAGAEHYVRDIHLNFFQVQHSINSINIQGWGGVKKSYPTILTHRAVKDYGFYSGIVNKVEEQVNKYRNLFISFEKDEHNLPTRQTETESEQETQTENDFTLSTIEDWLFEFTDNMNEADYQNLVSALIQYFETGTFPTLSKPIQINGRPNKKLFGWALNRIFKAKGKGVEKELLQFAKQNISLFTDVPFDENNILNSNLYKYFTTQTK